MDSQRHTQLRDNSESQNTSSLDVIDQDLLRYLRTKIGRSLYHQINHMYSVRSI
jgi:hypothetical protein